MKITCFYCGKPVTNELPEDTVFRGTAECPECSALSNRKKAEVLLCRYINEHPKQ